MGTGYKLECKKCGFIKSVSLGIGFCYPQECRQTLEKMKDGEFGEEFRRSANTLRGAAIHQERALFRCDSCGSLENKPAIDLCTVREGYTEDDHHLSYVMDFDIGREYEIARSVEHQCERCQAPLKEIKLQTIVRKIPLSTRIPCPTCEKKLSITDWYEWD